MSESLHRIEQDLVEIKQSIQTVENAIQLINISIDDAEQHILNDEKVNFWEPKLASLRQDKAHLLKKEDRLHDEALVLEKSRLATIQSMSSEFGFFNMDGEEEGCDGDSGPRGRHATWHAGNIALADPCNTSGSGSGAANSNSNSKKNNGMKTVESSPSVMTQVPEEERLNHDPNAPLQGQNRRPHLGNFKAPAINRVDSYNVFGNIVDEDEDEAVSHLVGVLPLSAVKRDESQSSISEVSENGEENAGVGKFILDFFSASEQLLLAQANEPRAADVDGDEDREGGDKFGSPLSIAGPAVSKASALPRGLQPVVSAHDFSLFGADLYNDNSDEDN